jgi:transposase-like protein
MDISTPALPQGRRVRRQYSTEFRVQVIEAASQPGVSVAAIALANGMNANLLRRWISMARGREMMIGAVTGTSPAVQGFVPLATPSLGSDRDVRIELSRGSMSIKVSWPVGAAGACALWVREVMR